MLWQQINCDDFEQVGSCVLVGGDAREIFAGFGWCKRRNDPAAEAKERTMLSISDEKTTQTPTTAPKLKASSKSAKRNTTAKAREPKPSGKPKPRAATKPRKPGKGSKQLSGDNSVPKSMRIVELLRRSGGATIAELMKATGWQAHSVRGFLSGVLKKRQGLLVAGEKDEAGMRRYRIAEEPR